MIWCVNLHATSISIFTYPEPAQLLILKHIWDLILRMEVWMLMLLTVTIWVSLLCGEFCWFFCLRTLICQGKRILHKAAMLYKRYIAAICIILSSLRINMLISLIDLRGMPIREKNLVAHIPKCEFYSYRKWKIESLLWWTWNWYFFLCLNM